MRRLSESDLRFVVETVADRRRDHERVVELIRDKPDLVEPLLDDPRLMERLAASEETLARLSPYLLFSILLRQVQRDLEGAGYVYEIGARGRRLPVFEAPQVVELLHDTAVREYLVELLCSFVRTHSSVVYWKERGTWHKRKFSDLDMDDMILLAKLVPPELRARYYQRVADLALFYSGVFPDYAALSVARPRTAFTAQRTLADYESEGQRFYKLLARQGDEPRLTPVFETLGEQFTLARRALNTLSDRYLKAYRARYFAPPGG